MSRRILIVEDDEDLRRNLTLLLSGEGYQVEAATDGAFALKILNNSQDLPCVILLDIMMPVMNGLEFRERQLQDPRLTSIPTVVMSADMQIAAKGRKMAATDLLKKPVEIDSLLEIVGKFCAGQ